MNNKNTLLDRAIGCLLAGAAGDALGAPVEFLDRAEILRRFSAAGIRQYAPAYGGIGKITDDTQMTLFTAEGCLRAYHHSKKYGTDNSREIIRNAYLRWLHTQVTTYDRSEAEDSWLLKQSALFSRRAPGNTCLSALSRKGGEQNNSKGCGGIMRVAPCGILHPGDPWAAFNLGSLAAKLTHGHPSGYLAAGVFAALVAGLMAGEPLVHAADTAREILIDCPQHEETLHALDTARALANRGETPEKAIPMLGEGWVAEEALAISLYCALSASDLKAGIVMAVNITGDSDSTGAITGNFLGAMHGVAAIPQHWLDPLELKDVIEMMACDLVQLPDLDGNADKEQWLDRYPAS